MTREIIGDACAFIKQAPPSMHSYVKIGVAMKDEAGRISLKLDSLPFDPKWEGWINIFPRDLPSNNPRADYTSPAPARSFSDFDYDDHPF